MLTQAIATSIYAGLLLIGGVIGYMTAQSLPSLIMGSLFAVLLGLMAFGMFKGCAVSKTGALIMTGLLLAFFSYRFFITYKFMPSGLMVLLSAALFICLLFCNKTLQK